MSLARYMLLPGLILAVAVIYWFVSGYEMAGSVMLFIFSLGMAVFGWALVPAAENVGPTAPVDPDFEDPGR